MARSRRGRSKKLDERLAWERGQAQKDRERLQAAGLHGLAAQMAPPSLSADVSTLWHAWRFCGGWVPERLPLYHALHPVDDPLLLVELMHLLRDRLSQEKP